MAARCRRIYRGRGVVIVATNPHDARIAFESRTGVGIRGILALMRV